jgi:hypothetical protein
MAAPGLTGQGTDGEAKPWAGGETGGRAGGLARDGAGRAGGAGRGPWGRARTKLGPPPPERWVASGPAEAGWWPLGRLTLVRLSGAYALSRLIVTVASLWGNSRAGSAFSSPFRAWDGFWYLWIAVHGYPTHYSSMAGVDHLAGPGQWAVAFPPGYPLAIAGLAHLCGLPVLASALVLSGVGGWVSTIMVARLAALRFDRSTAERSALLLCFFPGAFVFSWAYAEGLGLALALGALFCLMRGRWWAAGLLAAGCSAVRVDLGAALCVAAAVASAQAGLAQRQWRPVVAPALAPGGFLAYLVYLQVHTGDWRNWRVSEQVGWLQRTDFGVTFMTNLQAALRTPWWPPSDLILAGALFAAAVGWAVLRRPLPGPLAAFSITVLVIAFWTSGVGFRPRTLLELGPAFASLAALAGRRATWSLLLAFVAVTPVLLLAYLAPPLIVP